jgi:cytochrome c556
MRPIAIAITLFAAIGTCWFAWAADEQPMSFWMKKKLEHSQSALRSIAVEDFDALRASANAMRRLSDLEGFARRTDAKEYRAQLQIFEFANDELIRNANEKNIDGAALAFTQLTLSCVNCHKHLRDEKQ